MSVEAVTYISDLNATYPAAGDSQVEGDDHIRNLKTGIKATFPNIAGAVTPTHTELNYVDGVTSAIQTQLDTLSAASLRLITASSASASAAIDFTSGISSTYDEYELHIINAIPSGASAIPWIRTSTDGGSTFASTSGDYVWITGRTNATSFTVTNDGGTGTAIVLHNQAISTAANYGYSAVVRFYQPASTTLQKEFNFSGGGPTSTGCESSSGTGTRAATAAINAIRFMFASGNIASGEFKLYGVKKS